MFKRILKVLFFGFFAMFVFGQSNNSSKSAGFIADEESQDPLIQFRIHLAKQ